MGTNTSQLHDRVLTGSALGAGLAWLIFLPVPVLVLLRLFNSLPSVSTSRAAVGVAVGGGVGVVVAFVLAFAMGQFTGVVKALVKILVGLATPGKGTVTVDDVTPRAAFLLGAGLTIGLTAVVVTMIAPRVGPIIGSGGLIMADVAGTLWNPTAVDLLPLGQTHRIGVVAGLQITLAAFFPQFLYLSIDVATEVLLE